ncbi:MULTISPECIES: tRNA (5-methylaminomethyl-2-thiouridine)(34)-methyltransferase MnmD [Roseobacteraceae]|jgi:tRNA U34 5-methylaminomethyl-2-thiouridine-forming methyltransferase MnmC|uniref:tRNA 5-methylaminomethyl-2-thiouridine biosynthesis bifunctional protein MnmC n=1 Tax=Pseudosulfitobacter pseudonitzschiae TaxID=1402135 RepID=A0A221K5F4_9RHOB|nr:MULTISPECIES: tRNA (5-methylaminomethyl-2-thiouridine)(34)-methyltransferase MnmD [Roseobacteraceae]ASM74244.1 tRNA 5-methylaminomethyl-2-thiouridine biosynthesis bifunctional protein MnmC [Pseudosulfitobacter pseudonitzschiae]
MQDQHADLEWRDGDVPVSTRFDDPYFSLENGLDETRHVFLAGNGLPERFCDGFHVGELGFGTGLNFVVTLAAWRAAGTAGVLRFTSFEAYPMSVPEMARALGAFGIGDELVAVWNGRGGRFDFGDATLEVIAGDARATLPAWQGAADAWFLDGFSPAKNPELWDAKLMQSVADHTAANGTVATYTAAGFVRRGLDAAGFDVSRVSGYGRKRHMTVGTKR